MPIANDLLENSSYQYYVYDSNIIPINIYKNNPIDTPEIIGTFYPDSPIILTDASEIENWSFQELTINLNGIVPSGIQGNIADKIVVRCNNGQSTFSRIISVNDYLQWNEQGGYIDIFSIPSMYVTAGLNFSTNNVVEFSYIGWMGDGIVEYDLGTYSVSLTESQAALINQDSDRYNQIIQTEESQKTNDLLTDSEIDESAISFPTVDVQDGGVLNAMSSFFDKIYNAFTNGTLLDIVIPIPFTNRNIVIPYNYTETQLRNANASWIIDIIQLGWWYIIGRYIIINLFEKVIMMMRGSVERVQMTNITTKLL